MKRGRVWLPLLVSAYLPICAAGTEDIGTVVELFTTPTGGIAIHLSNGFPNAVAAGECTTSNGWAGHLTADPVLKAALLSAKATGQTVRVAISGCEGSGAWWKIEAVYLE